MTSLREIKLRPGEEAAEGAGSEKNYEGGRPQTRRSVIRWSVIRHGESAQLPAGSVIGEQRSAVRCRDDLSARSAFASFLQQSKLQVFARVWPWKSSGLVADETRRVL